MAAMPQGGRFRDVRRAQSACHEGQGQPQAKCGQQGAARNHLPFVGADFPQRPRQGQQQSGGIDRQGDAFAAHQQDARHDDAGAHHDVEQASALGHQIGGQAQDDGTQQGEYAAGDQDQHFSNNS
jgi:hypothetical protein